jgi:NAD(P)-dependent dehydrogenase (short-subunit alcohol dehydrogenase family)
MAPLFDLTGRVAVIVGGTSGIGRAIALGLAGAGADVAVTGRRAALVETVATEVEAFGRRTIRQPADVEDAASLERLRDRCVEELGGVDIAVCAAGITRKAPSLTLPEEEWSRVLETNVTGTFRTCRIFAAPMLARGRGRIMTIASLSSFLGFFEVSAYTASKSAVAGLTRALAVEWAPHGVTVNAIAPGVFKTDMNRALLDSPRGQELLMRTPMRRFGELHELIGAAVFLASDASAFVTGHILPVDGGFLASGVNQ